MKIAPVSADLLIKAALIVGGLALAVWAVRKVAGAAGDVAGQAWTAAGDAAWAVTPWNNENVIYQTVNGALFPSGQDTLGTWLYGITHPEPRTLTPGDAFYVPDGWDVTPQGPNGPRYNNPSAYIAPVGSASIYR
mgnify:CR=1 FL=1